MLSYSDIDLGRAGRCRLPVNCDGSTSATTETATGKRVAIDAGTGASVTNDASTGRAQ